MSEGKDKFKAGVKENKQEFATEPSVAYIQNFDTILESKLAIVSRQTQVSALDKITLIRNGITKSTVLKVAHLCNISIEVMCDLIHISARTLQRKAMDESMGQLVSERTLEIADVVVFGVEVFYTLGTFQEWLSSELPVLENKAPLSFLDTAVGCNYMHTMLGRIEHGIYS